MFKPAEIFFLGALTLLAGCSTTPPTDEPVTSPAPDQAASSLNWVDTNAIPQVHLRQLPKTNWPVAINSNRPPMVRPNPAPVTTWTSLNRWAAERHLAAPRLLSNVPVASYQIKSEQGAMILVIGSHEAAWNGMEINLGFEPQLIDGQVFLHGLDLQKNLEPLLCCPPLTLGTNPVIVIDPGHGGSNTGTHSILDGRFEKEFTLDWAQRLKPLLETNGWKVFLTRTNDSYVTNTSRAVFAEARHADLFISLHFNSAAPDPRPAGLETYCFTPAGMPSTVTRGYADPWTEKLSSNDFDAQNLQLAVKLQGALLRATGREDRGVRHVRYIEVLRNQKRPAILIEGGYLSNPAEAKLIESSEYRQKLAETVAAALK